MTVEVQGKKDTYAVTDLVAKNDVYRLRKCVDSRDREMIFQIAADASHNSELARNGYALIKLKDASDAIEKEYKDGGHEGSLNYDLGFPELTDSFVFDGQGSRHVNIIRFREIERLDSISPLLRIWKGGLRVDLPTSAWILGKLLKTVSFAHDNRIQVGNITGNNVLIQADQHYVIIFDWSGMTVHERRVPSSVVRDEIKTAASLVIKAVGDLEKAMENEADLPYTRLLHSLATDGMSDARKAHETFYGVVDSLCGNPESTWKNGFHHFTTYHL